MVKNRRTRRNDEKIGNDAPRESAADFEVFRGLKLAYDAGKQGESYPIVYNAANEAAVDLFMNKKINYTDIYKIIEDELNAHKQVKSRDLDIIMDIDREIKNKIYNLKNILLPLI